MEAGTRVMAIPSSMWLPGQGSGHGHHRNQGHVCHHREQDDPGGEASFVGPDHPPVPGRGRPKESPSGTNHSKCTVDHAAFTAGGNLIYASCHVGICCINLIASYLS